MKLKKEEKSRMWWPSAKVMGVKHVINDQEGGNSKQLWSLCLAWNCDSDAVEDADVEDAGRMILLNAVDADVKCVKDMKEKDAGSKVQASRASEDALSHLDTQEVISRMVAAVTIQK